jgi:hypothetical protein
MGECIKKYFKYDVQFSRSRKMEGAFKHGICVIVKSYLNNSNTTIYFA